MMVNRTLTILCAGLASLLCACAVVEPQVHSVIVNDRVVAQPTQDVRIIRGDVTIPAGPGTTVQEGDRVITGPASEAVLLLENGSVEIIMMENAEITIGSIFVKIGEVFVRIKERVEDLFEVESEYVGATPVTTEFVVSIDASGRYECAILDGSVRLRSKDNSWPPETLRMAEVLVSARGSTPSRRVLSNNEFNELVKRLNAVEGIYRQGAAQLMMPRLVGMQEKNAQDALRAIGVRSADVNRVLTGRQPIGEVVATQPKAGGRIEPGMTVQLDVEAEPTTVPSVAGRTIGEAAQLLRDARLVIGEQTMEITGRNNAGTINRQEPGVNARVPVGTKVNLWIEDVSVRVPNLMNLSKSRAEQALVKYQLALGAVSYEPELNFSREIVRSQSVPANTPIAPGTRVDIVLSAPGARVPTLTGKTTREASRFLRNYGLLIGDVSYTKTGGTYDKIIRQDPTAGTVVASNTRIAVTVVEGCTMPNVDGMSSSAAVSSVRKAGLTPVTYVRQGTNSQQDTVHEQSLNPGWRGNCGTTVRLGLGIYVVQ